MNIKRLAAPYLLSSTAPRNYCHKKKVVLGASDVGYLMITEQFDVYRNHGGGPRYRFAELFFTACTAQS